MKPFRIQPAGRPQDYRTYSLVAPLATHWRPATCAEADCPVSAAGWRTTIDEATPLGVRQAGYLRNGAGRHYTEHRAAELTVFVFPAGEECFTAHQIRSDQPPRFIRRAGDWRSYGATYEHTGGRSWVEDFAEHQDRLAHQRNR